MEDGSCDGVNFDGARLRRGVKAAARSGRSTTRGDNKSTLTVEKDDRSVDSITGAGKELLLLL